LLQPVFLPCRRREGAHDGIDHLVGMRPGQGCAAEQEPVEERPDQELVRDPDVGVGAQSPRATPRSMTDFTSARRRSTICSR
jgi:hypothetical protein